MICVGMEDDVEREAPDERGKRSRKGAGSKRAEKKIAYLYICESITKQVSFDDIFSGHR